MIQLNPDQIASLIQYKGQNYVLTHYIIPESYVLENPSQIDCEHYIRSHHVSEDFIRKALEIEYLSVDNLKTLSMTTLSHLSKEFIQEYSEFIDWNKMMLYLSCSDDMINFEDYILIIDSCNLWSIISANSLPIEFVREYKHKLDWRVLTITQPFTPEQCMEFEDYLSKTEVQYAVEKENRFLDPEKISRFHVDIQSVNSDGIFAIEENIDSIEGL